MLSPPTFSVLIPTRDRPEYLAKALGSIEAQTAENFEAIVVNDHPPSLPAVRDLVEQFDPRFRLIANETNLGLARSRQRAFETSTGRFVALLDDDDFWAPTFLEQHLLAHQEMPDVSFVYCGYVRFWDDPAIEPRTLSALPPPDDLFLTMLRGEFTIGTSSVVTVKREWFEKVGGFDHELPGFEDWDFLCRLSQVSKAAHIIEPLVWYRQHFGARESLGPDRLASLERIASKWREHPEVAQMIRRSKAEFFFNLSRQAVLAGRRRQGVVHLAEFIRSAPRSGLGPILAAKLILLNLLGKQSYLWARRASEIAAGRSGRRHVA